MRRALYQHIFLSAVLSLIASPAFSEIYTWKDSKGNVHMTDDLSKVPPDVPRIDKETAQKDSDERKPNGEDQVRKPAARRAITGTMETVSGIDIIDYGLFSVKEFGTIPEKNTATGQLTVGNVNTLKLVKKTDRVPAVLGNKFGVRFRLKGATPGEQVMITTKVQMPGLKKTVIDGRRRSEQGPLYEETWNLPKTVGEVTYSGYVFEKDWELVPGTWIIQLFYGEKWLGEQIFEVYREEKKSDPSVTEAMAIEIEKLRSQDCDARLRAVRLLQGMGSKAAPAIPALIQAMRYYSLPYQIAFDCGSGKAAPVALAAIGQAAVQPLIHALADSELIIREGAKEALVRIGKSASPALVSAFQLETDMFVRLGAAEVLGQLKEQKAVVPLMTALTKDPLPPVRGKAAEVLGILHDTRAVTPLTSVIRNKNENWHVRSDALEALLKLKGTRYMQDVLSSLGEETDPSFKGVVEEMKKQKDDGRTIDQPATVVNNNVPAVRSPSPPGLILKEDNAAQEALIKALRSPDGEARRSAASKLGDAGDSRAVEPLVRLLKDENWKVRAAAVSSLGKLRYALAVGPLMETYKTKRRGEDYDIRPAVIRSLGLLGDKRATSLVMTAVRDDNPSVRTAAIVVLGSLKDEQAIDLLIDVMKGKITGGTNEAKTSLGTIGGPAVKPLIESLRGERTQSFRLHAIEVLAAIGATAVEPLTYALQDKDHFVKESAAEALGRLKDSRAVRPLMASLNDRTMTSASVRALGMIGAPSVKPLTDGMGTSNMQLRAYFAMALGETRDKLAVPPLMKALEDGDSRVRSNAAEGLGKLNDPQAVPKLIRALEDSNGSVRGSAAGALGKLQDKRAVEPLLTLLKNDRESRWYSVESLGQLRDKRATVQIIPYLTDADRQLRLKAAEALALLEDNHAVDALIEALNDKDRDVKGGAANALRQTTKKTFGDDPAEWRKWRKQSAKLGS